MSPERHHPDEDLDAVFAPQDLSAPPHLESRVVERLRHEGLLATHRGWPRRPWLAAAATFLLGIVLGAWWPAPRPQSDASASRFLLLLYPHESGTTSLVDRDSSTRAHGAWVTGLRSRGQTITGERLAPETGAAVGFANTTVPAPAPEGFFVVGATSLAEATRIARESPHAQEGGRIVVRAIDTPSAR